MSDSRVAAGSILLMSLLGKDVITWNQKDNDNDDSDGNNDDNDLVLLRPEPLAPEVEQQHGERLRAQEPPRQLRGRRAEPDQLQLHNCRTPDTNSEL